jgi:hypothetical protein
MLLAFSGSKGILEKLAYRGPPFPCDLFFFYDGARDLCHA